MVDLTSRSQLGSSRTSMLPTQIFKITSSELKDLFNRELGEQERQESLSSRHGGLEGLCSKLQTRINSGIMGDQADLNRRQHKYSKNEKPKPQRPPFFDSLKDALNDRILLIVAILAVLSIIPGMVINPASGWVEGVFILIALFVQVLISALNDYSKDTKFVELQSMCRDENLPALRGKLGSMQTVDVWNLVVGDIVTLQPGDKIPADCLVLESQNLHVKQIQRTDQMDGPTLIEWTTVYRNSEQPFLYADSYVLGGTCKAVVCCVGEFSTRGINDTTFDTTTKETDLTRKLSNIAGSLKFVALISALVILATSLIVLFVQTGVDEQVGGKIFTKKLVDCFIISTIILIVAIPEGLPMTVAVSLAHSVLLMSEHDNVLVRDLESVEVAGLLDDVCIGKTGTMTTEDMSVVSIFAENTLILNSRKNTLTNCNLDPEIVEKIVESITLNSQAYIEMTENSFYLPVGNGTEVSLLKWLQDAEVAVHEVMQSKDGFVRAHVPFSSTLKRSIIAIQHPKLEDTVRIYIKGAPEIIVNNCQNHYTYNDATNEFGQTYKAAEKVPFDESEKSRVLDDIMKKRMTQDSLRAIAFSYCDMSVSDFEQLKGRISGEIDSADEIAEFEQNQTFLALVALKDPVRDNMKEMIKDAEAANICVSMISGDNLMTAAAVACDVGIITPQEWELIKIGDSEVAMDASQFRQIVGDVIREKDDVEDGIDATTSFSLSAQNQQEFNSRLFGRLRVVGRAEPEDKLRLVVALRGTDEPRQVAVVGEGINDIEAFEAAHVSFAVADGTSLARNTASMILQTNDFNSCVQAVKWGRNIYMNVRRFIQFQVTCNLAALIVVFVSYCTKTESVLNAVQLIYINLIMDVLGAIAIGSTRPSKGKSTYNAGDNVMTGVMYRQIFGVTMYMTLIMMIVMYCGASIFELPYLASTQTTEDSDAGRNKMAHFTLIFNTFIFLQVFNLINCRDVSTHGKNGFAGIHRNFYTCLIILVIVGIQFLSCYTNLGRPIFETRAVESRMFCITVASAASILAASAIIKMIPARLVSKLPVLDEEKAIGSDSKFVSAFDSSAKGAAFQTPGQQVPSVDNEELDQSILNSGHNSMESGEKEELDDSYHQA